MISRADFTVNNLKGRLISPVIFGNISKIYFDIFSEEKANKEIQRLIDSNTLISDMILKEDLPFKISQVKEEKRALILGEDFYGKSKRQIINIKPKDRNDFIQNLFQKREEFREYKKAVKKLELESGIPSPRLRNSISRFNGTTIDKALFLHNEFKYNSKSIFSIYVSTNDRYVIELMELVFKIIEKVGIGTDTTIGNGVIKFTRYNDRIFVKANDVELLKTHDEKAQYFNIASTIITDTILKTYEFKDYNVKRYDSRTPEKIKPCYYYIECGSIVNNAEECKAYIVSNPNEEIKTYTCIFPVKFKEGDYNEKN